MCQNTKDKFKYPEVFQESFIAKAVIIVKIHFDERCTKIHQVNHLAWFVAAITKLSTVVCSCDSPLNTYINLTECWLKFKKVRSVILWDRNVVFVGFFF